MVWNRGVPPDPLRDLRYSGGGGTTSGVPVRIRVEAANSMNNRFRPDPEIINRRVWGGGMGAVQLARAWLIYHSPSTGACLIPVQA